MRPSLQIKTPKIAPPFLNEELNDDFFSDLDKAFEKIQITPRVSVRAKASRPSKKTVEELEPMKETFIELAQVHLGPVLRYLKAIQLGVASKDLCEIVHYVIGPIIGKTRKVGLVDQTKALVRFQRILKEVVRGASGDLSSDQRTALTASFSDVQKTFELDFRGHSTAVVNLLGFYKAIKRNKSVEEQDIRKLFAIGVPSITMLRKSSIDELVGFSGIHPERVAELRQHARGFNILPLV